MPSSNSTLTRPQRWMRLSDEDRELVRSLAAETGRPLWQVFEELYREESGNPDRGVCPSETPSAG